MAARIRLKRLGRRHRSFYRVVVMDAKQSRDSKVKEEVGFYDPESKDPEQQYKLDRERIEYWLGVGAKCSETVRDLCVKSGIAVKS